MKDNEVLVGIHIPIPNSSNKYFIQSYKQGRRRDDSKGIVSAGFKVELEQSNLIDKQWKIISICFSFGGMASKTIQPINTQHKLIGLFWNKETINQTYELIIKEIPLDELSPGGQPEFRRTLIQSFIFKFYSYVYNELHQTLNDSNILSYHRPISHGQQTIPERPQTQKVVGSSLPHRSAYFHTTGEAIYVDDMPSLVSTLHAALVLSTKSNARIKNVDTEAASKVPGFVSFVSYLDVPGSNKTNGVLPDEEVFVSSIALCIGSIIGIVVCETEDSAKIASNLINIDYELLSPTIFSIDDAIKHHSYFGDEISLKKGDVQKCFIDAEHILEDTFYIGGQEHFYMETNSFMVIPSNDDKEIALYVGTQSPTAVQELTASVLDRDVSQIICHVKRVGGGFGGKESRS
jgi:xanthine dehydrogenase/oxidase